MIWAGQGVRLTSWERYKDDPPDAAPADRAQWLGEVVETWGTSRTFVKVKREHDGRRVIVFAEDIEVLPDWIPFAKRKAKREQPPKMDELAGPKLF